MPCKDTTAKIIVWLDKNEKLINFDFTKLSCSKIIGVGTPFMQFCIGHHIDDILDINFDLALQTLNSDNDEENFLMYLEWDALKSALQSYVGQNLDSQRYQVASILHTEEGVKISIIIKPVKTMPKTLFCCNSGK